MALQIVMETGLGITAQQAYAKINNFEGSKEGGINVCVNIFLNKAARNSGAEPFKRIIYRVRFDADAQIGIMSQIYTELKSLPEFNNAQDV
jgi:hypothetical protein